MAARKPRRPSAAVALESWEGRRDRFIAAFARRDWRRLAAQYSPDLVLVDHRLGMGARTSDREQVLASWRASVERFSDLALRIDLLVLRTPLIAASSVTMTGTNDEFGTEWEFGFVQVTLHDARERMARVEIYAPEDREVALDRAEQLAIRESLVSGTPERFGPPPPSATHAR